MLLTSVEEARKRVRIVGSVRGSRIGLTSTWCRHETSSTMPAPRGYCETGTEPSNTTSDRVIPFTSDFFTIDERGPNRRGKALFSSLLSFSCPHDLNSNRNPRCRKQREHPCGSGQARSKRQRKMEGSKSREWKRRVPRTSEKPRGQRGLHLHLHHHQPPASTKRWQWFACCSRSWSV